MKKTLFFAYKNILRDSKSTILVFIAVLFSVFFIICGLAATNSFSTYKLSNVELNTNAYNLVLFDVEKVNTKGLEKEEEIEAYNFIKNVGYSKIENKVIDTKEYIFIQELDDKAIENEKFELANGRTPLAADEIIIPLEYSTYFNYKVGDTLSLNVGDLKTETHYLFQLTSRINSNKIYEDQTKFHSKENRNYKIVGIYKSSDSLYIDNTFLNHYYLYSYLNKTSLLESDILDVTIKFKNPEKTAEYVEKYSSMVATTYQNGSYSNIWNNYREYKDIKYLKVVSNILSLIITISLSYFMIITALDYGKESRNRYFAQLTTLGATPNELRKSSILGALVITSIALPFALCLTLAAMFILNYIFIEGSSGISLVTFLVTHANVVFTIFVVYLLVLLAVLKTSSSVLYIVSLDSINGGVENIRTKFVKYNNLVKIKGEISKYVESNSKLKDVKTTTLKLSIALAIISIMALSAYLIYGIKPAINNLESQVSNITVTVLSQKEELNFLNDASKLKTADEYSIYRELDTTAFTKINQESITNVWTNFKYDRDRNIYLSLKIVSVSDLEFKKLAGAEDVKGIYISEYAYKSNLTSFSIDLIEPITQIDIYGKNELNEKGEVFKVDLLKTINTYPYGISKNNGGMTLILNEETFDEYQNLINKKIVHNKIIIKTKEELKLVNEIDKLIFEKYPNVVVNASSDQLNKYNSSEALYSSEIQCSIMLILTIVSVILIVYMYNLTYAKTREKEIGLLKSMGATSKNVKEVISRELGSDFLISILCAILLGIGFNIGLFRNFVIIDETGKGNIDFLFPLTEILLISIISYIVFKILINISTKELRNKKPIDLLKDNFKEF